MTTDTIATSEADLLPRTTALVRRWLREADAIPTDASGARLAGVLRDPKGLAFTVGFVDGVIRPEDLRAAAKRLAAIAPDVPAFLPAPLKAAVRLGGIAAPILPGIVVPIARWTLRRMVGHLIIDATPKRLGGAIERIRRRGVRLNVNLLGEAVLGEHEAGRRLEGTRALIARDDVDYVSIKVSAAVAPHSPWAFDDAVRDVVERLTPLYDLAAANGTFINLDMEEYHDLDLTIAVFTRLLDEPRFAGLEAGIVLQAYLPDALGAMMQLQDWSAARRARGGASIKVRLVKGANLPMERVESSLHDWPLATWHTKQQTDTNYKRVLDWALTPERVDAVRVGVAGHNLFDVAHAWLLAGDRGVRGGIEFEMLLGMATSQAEVVRREVGGLLVYTPVVKPAEFDVAIAYLIRRLEEGASSDNFMSAVFDLTSQEALFAREEARFAAAVAGLDGQVPAPHRVPRHVTAHATDAPFTNAVDTDPAVAEHRTWGLGIQQRAATSDLGRATLAASTTDDAEVLEDLLDRTAAAAAAWASRPAADRAEVLQRVGDELEARRGDLVEVMMSEAGKTIDQADPEVSEAIDFARYYAASALELELVDGARFTPSTLTLVAPPWNFPVAIPVGGVLAALATGSGVILKPAVPASRCGAVLAEILWSAGVPTDVLGFVQIDEDRLGERLLTDDRVDRVILTGAYETAELFRGFRPDLQLHAETSGKNAMIVTPSADLDLAVKDLVNSAFSHAGQKCSAASLAILVGSVAESRRFLGQLTDAVASLTVGPAEQATTQMGPLIEAARGKLLSGLTELGAGESWLLEPTKLDDDGFVWTPGIRTGVQPGSDFHLTEYFGPVLGIMTAPTLARAIELQNQVAYGLTAGLHALEPSEIGQWVDDVEAGNLYVNRGTTGAIVGRQPFGGWKRSSVGRGAKAGGPNYLVGLGAWTPTESVSPGRPATFDSGDPFGPASATLSQQDRIWLGTALDSDSQSWATEFGATRDLQNLEAERNLFRYRPLPVTIRVGATAATRDVLRVLAAGHRAGAPLSISTAVELDPVVSELAARLSLPVRVESAPVLTGRVRAIGESAPALLTAAGGTPDLVVWDDPVTIAGRLELLPFLREQSISVTAHRFGTPNHLTDDLF